MKCKHRWIHLALEAHRGRIAGEWYWCSLCGATKHIVMQKDYYGLDDNGIYIRHVGVRSKAKLVKRW